MIVSVAILAWSVYTDQRTRRSRPPLASWVARQVHITLRKQDEVLRDGTERLTEICRHRDHPLGLATHNGPKAARQEPVLLTDLLTRRHKTEETGKKADDGRRVGGPGYGDAPDRWRPGRRASAG